MSTSVPVQVFGRRHDEPFQTLWRPASKKRQGRRRGALKPQLRLYGLPITTCATVPPVLEFGRSQRRLLP